MDSSSYLRFSGSRIRVLLTNIASSLVRCFTLLRFLAFRSNFSKKKPYQNLSNSSGSALDSKPEGGGFDPLQRLQLNTLAKVPNLIYLGPGELGVLRCCLGALSWCALAQAPKFLLQKRLKVGRLEGCRYFLGESRF